MLPYILPNFHSIDFGSYKIVPEVLYFINSHVSQLHITSNNVNRHFSLN